MLPEKVGFISYIYNFITHFPTSPNFFVGEKILCVRGSTLLPPALIHSPVKVLVEWLTYIFHTGGLTLNTFFLSLINVFNCSKVIVLQVFLSRSDKKKKKSLLYDQSFGSSLLSFCLDQAFCQGTDMFQIKYFMPLSSCVLSSPLPPLHSLL